jgi:flagellar motor protein MotB
MFDPLSFFYETQPQPLPENTPVTQQQPEQQPAVSTPDAAAAKAAREKKQQQQQMQQSLQTASLEAKELRELLAKKEEDISYLQQLLEERDDSFEDFVNRFEVRFSSFSCTLLASLFLPPGLHCAVSLVVSPHVSLIVSLSMHASLFRIASCVAGCSYAACLFLCS